MAKPSLASMSLFKAAGAATTKAQGGSLTKKAFWCTGDMVAAKGFAANLGIKVYTKKADKWMNNYDDEEVILIDEIITHKHKKLAYNLSKWADHGEMQADTVSGPVTLKHNYLVVLSEKLCDDIWKDNYTRDKLKIRFKEKHFGDLPGNDWKKKKLNGVVFK